MKIEIPEALLKRLQKHAIPFVDTTPLSVIERWADFYEQQNQQQSTNADSHAIHPEPAVTEIPNGVRHLDPKRPPSLLHTRVRGEFGTTPFSNWNDLVRIAHVEAFKKKAQSFENLRRATLAQIRNGRYSNEGYHYVQEIDISIQGVDADRAWEYAFRLAVSLNVPLKVEVEWRQNDKAEHPGERAVMAWTP